MGANEGSEPTLKAPVLICIRRQGLVFDLAYEESQKLDRTGQVKIPIHLGAFKYLVMVESQGSLVLEQRLLLGISLLPLEQVVDFSQGPIQFSSGEQQSRVLVDTRIAPRYHRLEHEEIRTEI